MAATVRLVLRARVVCASCSLAENPWTRFRGLLGRRTLPPGEGLLLRPSNSVHTFFMRFPIDVVFLDGDLEVVAVAPAVRPWRVRAQRGARAVLELPAGEAAKSGLVSGDRLAVEHRSSTEQKEEADVLS
jgi:uncharacterized protein